MNLLLGSLECLKSSDGSADNESVNVSSTLVGIHRLEVADVSDDVILVDDAVAAEHVPRLACNLQGLSAVVTLDHGDHLGSQFALLVLQARNLQHRVQTEGNLGAHIRHLLLHELGLGKGAPELLAVERVVASLVETKLGCSHCTPGDTESSLVEAAEGSLKTSDI